MMQKKDKERSIKMSREQQLLHNKQMQLPINQFLNAKNKDGSLKYPISGKLRKYFVNNPDPALDSIRFANALFQKIKVHRLQSVKYLGGYHKPEGESDVKDKNGQSMSKSDCHLAYVSENHNIHLGLSKLRDHLVSNLLSKCDGEVFKFDQYNDYMLEMEKKVKDLGYELLPDHVELILPL